MKLIKVHEDAYLEEHSIKFGQKNVMPGSVSNPDGKNTEIKDVLKKHLYATITKEDEEDIDDCEIVFKKRARREKNGLRINDR